MGLHIIGTPIGNLADISQRVVECLQTVDLVAAEDTRRSIKLLNHLAIKKEMTSYHQHNIAEKTPLLIEKMQDGLEVGLVSDAGMPGISDPGQALVAACVEVNIPVEVVSGPTAFVHALVASGLETNRFSFIGFLPIKKKEAVMVLREVVDLSHTLLFYEAPHRLVKTLKLLHEQLGNRRVAIGRELTKRYEEMLYMTLAESLTYYETVEPKGEFVLVIAGQSLEKRMNKERQSWQAISLEEHYQYYQRQAMLDKAIIKQMANDRGCHKSEIYRYFHKS